MTKYLKLKDILLKLGQYFYKNEKLAFFIFSLYLTFEYTFLGPFSYVRIGDNIDSLIPRFVSNSAIFKQYQVTYWQPLLNGGADRLANVISFVDIGNLVFLLFPGWLSISLILISCLFIGSLYIYKLCYEIYKLSKNVSIFLGCAFALSLIKIDITSLMQGLCIMPFSLYYLEKFTFRKRLRLKDYFCIFLLGVIYSFFSSTILTLPFTLLSLLFWLIFVRQRSSIKHLSILIIFSAVAILPHVQDIAGMLLNSPLSQRGNISYFNVGIDYYFFWVKKLIAQNTIFLMIIIIGLYFIRIKNRVFTWSLVFLGTFLFLAPIYRPFSSVFGHFFKKFRNFDFGRFYVLVPFFAILSSGFILNKLPKNIFIRINKRKTCKRYNFQQIAIVSLIMLLIFTNLLTKFKHAKIWLMSGSYFANSYNSILSDLSNKSEAPFRTATISDRKSTLLPTLSHFHQLETIDGHINLTTVQNVKFFQAMAKNPDLKSSLYFFWGDSNKDIIDFKSNPEDFLNFSLLSLANVRYIISYLPINHHNLTLVALSSENRKYEWSKLTLKEKIMLKIQENFKGRKILVYENKKFLPRFYLTKSFKIFKNEKELIENLKTANVETFRNYAFYNSKDVNSQLFKLPTTPTFQESFERIKVKKYSPDEIQLLVNSNSQSILVITNNFNPYWKIYVNGQEEEILRTYLTFQSVVLNNKQSEVVLKYLPPYKL